MLFSAIFFNPTPLCEGPVVPLLLRHFVESTFGRKHSFGSEHVNETSPIVNRWGLLLFRAKLLANAADGGVRTNCRLVAG